MNGFAWVVPTAVWLIPICQIVRSMLFAMIAFYSLRGDGDAKVSLSLKPLRIEIERKEKRKFR